MMRLLNERDRALANRLLRSEDVLLEICVNAERSPLALHQLVGAASLLASLAYTLEHDLAFGAAPNPRCSEDWGEPCFDDRSDSDRWTVAKEHVNASAD